MDKKRFDKLMSEKYKPVPHTAEDTARLLSDPKLRAAYNALKDEFAALDALLKARTQAGQTQAKVAKRRGIKPSSVA